MIAVNIIIFFVLALRQLIVKLNSGFPIIELTVMLYVLQYLVAPLFQYNYYPIETMAVARKDYLPFTLVAVLAFALGLFSIKSKFNLNQLKIDDKRASLLGRRLVIIGFLSQIIIGFAPDALKSAINFFVLFKTIGVFALVFSNKKTDKLLIIFFSIQIALEAVLGAMLIEFVIFALFFSMFFSLRYKITDKIKYSFFIVGFLFLSVYQGVKAEYRELVWEKEVSLGERIALLGTLINADSFSKAFSSDFENNESLHQTMFRLNQGWQTSKVYNHMPSKVDFQYGKEFINDVLSSFLPRFLWPTKRVVNDQDRFYRYTGYFVNKSTATTMGVIGDFYMNFGKTGTVIALFLFGHFIARIKRFFIVKFVYTNPINLIWLPFIFSYLIRPGNEFYMVLNHLFKSVVVLVVVFKIIYPRLGIRNKKHSPNSYT